MDSDRSETSATGATIRNRIDLRSRWGWAFLLVAAGLFTAVSLPVIINGAPLLDDFPRCLEPQRPGYWSEHFDQTGAFRPMRFVEIEVTNVVCRTAPFSLAIVIPWLLTLGVALLLRSLLKDLKLSSPWPEIGAGLWLLAPLGTESALWPSAMHIPLALALALLSLRMFLRGKIVFGLALGLAGLFSLEQLIFALPLAGWWVSSPRQRSKVLALSTSLSVGVLALYAAWPGATGRLSVPLSERLMDVFRDIESYAILVGTGLGAHSIPTAIIWALPLSILVLVAGSAAGWVAGPRLLTRQAPLRSIAIRPILIGFLLLALLNVAVALTFPHPDSPRVFAPSWLALAAFAALIGSCIDWRRPHLVGALAGVLIAGSLVSLVLSSSVRIRSSRIVEDAMRVIAEGTPNDGIAAICGVTRTVVQPAPSGDFSIHDFFVFADDAYEYYTGKVAEIRVGGAYTEDRCPDLSGADSVFEFQELIPD